MPMPEIHASMDDRWCLRAFSHKECHIVIPSCSDLLDPDDD